MNIAIIGAGISGLAAAYRLHRQHRVTIFEAAGHVGGHTNTVDVEVDGRSYAVDTGFIVFNTWTYPNFVELLAELNVESGETSMGFSVRDDRTGLEYCGNSLNSLFAQRRNLGRPAFYRMLADILRFNRIARPMAQECDEQTTIGEFLRRGRFSREFAEWYLLPMGAAIWSCPTGVFAEFPLQFIVSFYANHGLLNIFHKPVWRYIVGGSKTYVAAMTREFADRIRLRTPIEAVRRHDDGVEIFAGGKWRFFDHIIFACHADQALRILRDAATRAEREILSAFPYSGSVATLHTDESLLPRRRRAWASWNYRLTGDEQSPATVTYNMNILQRIASRRTFCVTLNDQRRIDPNKVLAQFEYHHPVFDRRRAAAQRRHGELLGANRTSYCGAYWRNGFHEDGLVSALEVVAALNTRPQSGRGILVGGAA